ncbi:VapC toxin family PIN domain ribonuclease [Deltaproteobacteria bacterium TL4]
MMLVDIDVLIWYMHDQPKAVELLNSQVGFNISAVTYMEVVQGMRNKIELKALKDALKIWQARILPIDEDISLQAIGYVEQYFLSHGLKVNTRA